MGENYISHHFDDIRQFARITENRGDDSWCTKQSVLRDNAHYQREAAAHYLPIILIDDKYDVHLDLAQAQ